MNSLKKTELFIKENQLLKTEKILGEKRAFIFY